MILWFSEGILSDLPVLFCSYFNLVGVGTFLVSSSDIRVLENENHNLSCWKRRLKREALSSQVLGKNMIYVFILDTHNLSDLRQLQKRRGGGQFSEKTTRDSAQFSGDLKHVIDWCNLFGCSRMPFFCFNSVIPFQPCYTVTLYISSLNVRPR